MKIGLKKAGSVGAPDVVDNFETLRIEKAQKGNAVLKILACIFD